MFGTDRGHLDEKTADQPDAVVWVKDCSRNLREEPKSTRSAPWFTFSLRAIRFDPQ